MSAIPRRRREFSPIASQRQVKPVQFWCPRRRLCEPGGSLAKQRSPLCSCRSLCHSTKSSSVVGQSRWFRDARDRSVQPPTSVDVITSANTRNAPIAVAPLNHLRFLPFCLSPVARLEPASCVGRKLASYDVVVERQVLSSQHAAPAAVGALVDERRGASLYAK